MTIEKRYIWAFASPIAPKRGKVVIQVKETPPKWSPQKLKTSYPHFHKTYGNQTWQDGDLG